MALLGAGLVSVACWVPAWKASVESRKAREVWLEGIRLDLNATAIQGDAGEQGSLNDVHRSVQAVQIPEQWRSRCAGKPEPAAAGANRPR